MLFLDNFFFTFKKLQHDIWYTRNCLQKSLPFQYYMSKRLPIHKQPFRGVLSKRCSENIHQIYKRIPIPKCDFDKVGKQPYWNRTSALVFSYKFAAYFQNTFYKNTSERLLLSIQRSDQQWKQQNDVVDVVLVSSFLILNSFHLLLLCFSC